ncbi:hypothetical protein CWB72_14865 [Pseudoalteromonas phenolica]|uniref:hypothetical protein n=1 Tax=Pseudoalteromonas phenolica TaxID=161398 RepID=UPI00110A0C86|nr:hypothetical protein [Pseudoalteromonas phenolica]TMN87560.1 hypothetical protein CWB72_14865 [Pseudoalteromonas phenolica]
MYFSAFSNTLRSLVADDFNWENYQSLENRFPKCDIRYLEVNLNAHTMPDISLAFNCVDLEKNIAIVPEQLTSRYRDLLNLPITIRPAFLWVEIDKFSFEKLGLHASLNARSPFFKLDKNIEYRTAIKYESLLSNTTTPSKFVESFYKNRSKNESIEHISCLHRDGKATLKYHVLLELDSLEDRLKQYEWPGEHSKLLKVISHLSAVSTISKAHFDISVRENFLLEKLGIYLSMKLVEIDEYTKLVSEIIKSYCPDKLDLLPNLIEELKYSNFNKYWLDVKVVIEEDITVKLYFGESTSKND